MIYLFFRTLMRLTLKVYFKNIQVKGIENIPENGPVFFVANHPSAFMDPIVIASAIKRPTFFLAKGVIFQNKFESKILSKFHGIPIFRSHETPGLTSKNKETFSTCYNHFKKGGTILAFPEGVSLTERKIKKIQSGVARICLGAEAENNFSLNIKIIAIGLNYSNPHQFNEDVFINIGKPIQVSDFIELYKKDSFKAAHALTDEIRKSIESQVVAIEDSQTDKLVHQIELMFKAQLLNDLGYNTKQLEQDFNTTKSISDSVHYFLKEEPHRVEKIKYNIEMYLNELDNLSLNDSIIQSFERTFSNLNAIKTLSYLFLGLPFFLFGLVNNYLPFKMPGWIAGLISKRPEFRGSIAISVGTFTFLIFYLVQMIMISKYFNDPRITFSYLLLSIVCGLFAFNYYKRAKSFSGHRKVFSLFFRKSKLIAKIILKRQMIIDELEKGRRDFLDAKQTNKVY